MAPPRIPALSQSLFLYSTATLLLLSTLIQRSHAQAFNYTPGTCPDERDIAYTPFRPYFHYPHNSNQQCWTWAICVFSKADEARKQQFAATALIMGLVPITLKDIAWPERRVVYVTKALTPLASIFVLRLGLVPEETGDANTTKQKAVQYSWLARRVYGKSHWITFFWICVSSALLLAAYAGLAVMEIWSKRSALGCPFPIFVSMWYIAAVAPASIHTFFTRVRRRWEKKHGNHEKGEDTVFPDRKATVISAIQGANELWPVQFSWAVYYIAGTLIWTSIMAVTVPELVIWVALGCAVTATSKILGFFVCLTFEHPSRKTEMEG